MGETVLSLFRTKPTLSISHLSERVKATEAFLARTTQCVLLKAAEEAVLPVEVEVVAEVIAEGVVVVVAGEVAGVVRAKEVEAGDENAAVGAEFGVAREVVVVLADAVAGVKVAVVELVVEAVAAVPCGEEGAVVFAVVTPAEARSALRRGVAAVIGQRAAEGVHFSLGCGLAFFARRKCKMTERALSHSGPFSNTA